MNRVAWMAVLCCAQATAQDTNAHLSFEVVLIKPHNPSGNKGVLSGTSHPSPTRHSYVGTLKTFIKQAYKVQDVQISGGPKWLEQDIFEITAITSAPANPDQLSAMLKNLLAERFQLFVREEMRPLPVYDLVIAKNGIKVRPSNEDRGTSEGRAFLKGSMDSSDLARRLTSIVGRTVVDETRLKNTKYDVVLTWTPEDQAPALADNAGPSIFTAIQEQLGLRLEATRRPVQTLVIEHAEMPSGN